MKKITILKALVIAIPIAAAIFAQHIENKSMKYNSEPPVETMSNLSSHNNN